MPIDKSFVEKIESMAAIEVKELCGRTFVSKNMSAILDPEVDCVRMHTLTGLVDFLPSLAGKKLTLHVENFNSVSILSDIFGASKQREKFSSAVAFDLKHRFDHFISVEEFVVYIQSMFVQDETTASILKIVGNLSQGSELNLADDGFTQRATVKAGVTRVETVPLPNPITLRPFRTFADIEQPASKFVMRIKADKDRGPQCAIFEADGGAWKNTAIATIKAWLVGASKGMDGISVVA